MFYLDAVVDEDGFSDFLTTLMKRLAEQGPPPLPEIHAPTMSDTIESLDWVNTLKKITAAESLVQHSWDQPISFFIFEKPVFELFPDMADAIDGLGYAE